MPIRLEDPIAAAALITGASAVAVAIVNGLFQTTCTWMQNRRRHRRPTSLGGSNARSATGHRSWLNHHHKMMWGAAWPPGRRSVPVPCEEDRGEGPDTHISIRRSQPTGGR